MHSVLETPIFSKRADALFTQEERQDLIDLLAEEPRGGDLIPGLGGIRKRRIAGSGRGKRGGFRVIWYVASPNMPILALLIYGKNEQVNLTPDQEKAMLALIKQIKPHDKKEHKK